MYASSKKMVTAFASISLLSGIALSACSGGGTPAPGGAAEQKKSDSKPTAAGPKKPVKVVLPIGVSGEEAYYQEQMKVFNEKNPGIDLKVEFIPGAQYGNTISLMFASDDAPDIIRMNGSLPTKMTISYTKGWIQPLDKYVTDAFKKQFPENSFGQNSGTVVDGKIYGIPFAENKEPALRPLYYNVDILKKFGYDKPPATWSELKTMAARITKEGGGSVYGFTVNGKEGIQVPVVSMFETANGRYLDGHLTEGNLFYDAKTGKAASFNPALAETIQFFKSMAAENIYIPGWESVDGQNLFQQFASGKTAMILGQFWYATEIMKLNPKMNLGITNAPVPDSGRKGYKGVFSLTEPYFGITAKSKNPDEAWKVIEFFSTLQFHEGWHHATKLPTVLWQKYTKIDPNTEKLLNAALKDQRVAPYPGYMHKDGEKFWSNVVANAPKPDIKEIMTMAIVGNKDFEQLAKEYDQKIDALIDKEIDTLRKSGSDITRNVLIAPNDWNPMENYIK